MKSRTTAIWFVLAVLLAAVIWLLNTFYQPVAGVEKAVLAGLRLDRITGLQIIPGGAREISVIRTNKAWVLQKPFVYPAQSALVDALLGALQTLTPVLTFTAGDLSGRKNADAEFGFDHPLYRIDVTAGEQTWHLSVGNKTPPGDGVYMRVLGTAGAFVADAKWLEFLPNEAGQWRDTTLVDEPAVLDWIIITNGAQAIELQRNATNRLWRMVRPLQARADNLRIVSAIQDLRAAKVSKFITDDPKADLAGYGLEPAALDVWLGSGTNLVTSLHVGKDVTGAAGEVFARREGWNTVVATAKTPLAAWRGTVNDFRNPELLELNELSAPVAEIEVRGDENFTLQRRGTNAWTMAGEKFAVDPDRVNGFVHALANLRIVDFVQDVVTASGLQSYGLANPTRKITLRSVAGDTNSTQVQVLFGGVSTNGNNEIFAKRGDEDFVYALALNGLSLISMHSDYYRAPRVWSYALTNVAQVTIRQNGKLRQMTRTGTNEWSLTAGQGVINPPAVEEAVYRLGELNAFAWIGRKFDESATHVAETGWSVTVELKTGEKYELQFGQDATLNNARTRAAVVKLDGEPWCFIFPPMLYPLVEESLGIPAGTP